MVREKDRWIEASEVIPMFPTMVWKILLRAELHEPMDERLLALLGRLRRDLPALEPGRGWQSERTLHEREELGELRSCIGDVAKSVLRFLRSVTRPSRSPVAGRPFSPGAPCTRRTATPTTS
jgi:hypothetical protein